MIDKKPTSSSRLRRNNLAVLIPIAVLCLAAATSFFFLDERVFSSLRRHQIHWTSSDLVKAFIQLGKVWVPIWLLLLWFHVTTRLRPTLIALLALLLVAPTVLPIKSVVRRPRPRDIIKEDWRQEYRNEPFRSWSFPSGDTASAFAVATALVPFVSWYWIPVLFTTAAGVGFLRVAVLAHYPSDVCTGAAVGIFCGWLAMQIARRRLSPESLRFDWWQAAAIWCLVLIPVLIGLFEGLDQLLIFLKTYGLLTACIYIIIKAYSRFK